MTNKTATTPYYYPS